MIGEAPIISAFDQARDMVTLFAFKPAWLDLNYQGGNDRRI